MRKVAGYTLTALGSPALLCVPLFAYCHADTPESVGDYALLAASTAAFVVGLPFLPVFTLGLTLVSGDK